MSITKRFFIVASNIALALFWFIFVYINWLGFRETGKITLALSIVCGALVALLFILRENPVSVSESPLDWAITLASVLLAIRLRPTSSSEIILGIIIMALGITLQILSYLSLNRSFGLVPAERKVKTSGLYRFVRHPIYASYIILLLGYVISNYSLVNLAISIAVTVLLIIRLNREEKFLLKNEGYRNYLAETRWKLIPLLY